MTEPGGCFLPYGRHQIDEDDIAAVVSVLRSDSLTGGPVVTEFEQAFAARVGARFAVACANGTAGLHLAAMALDLGADDTVIVPTLTFLATANAARYVGAEVAFADVDPATGLMRPDDLQEAHAKVVNRKVRAVIPVHLNGQCVDMEAVAEFAGRHGMRVIEDACHAIGATYRTRAGEGVSVGACRHSDMTVFSLHPVKTIAMGEGGVVTTNDPDLHTALLRLRNHGMVREASGFVQREEAFDADGQPNPWYYEMPAPGYNYRASEIHCALGLSQLRKLDRFLARRRELADIYDRALAPLGLLLRPIPRVAGCASGWHLYVVQIDFNIAETSRAALMRKLLDRGIGTQVHYLPVHRQPYYRSRYSNVKLPGSDAYYASCLSLPFFPAMSGGEVERVVATLADELVLAE
ncbi:MAG: UDP-4-amino-4,6-dideoxy-N-acetyl-beta-L-altrosamine transaminase [Sulfuritalea sp.]|nr:UDP-4-amino-4,6-dideoxy-N-acetyl-beta-L-altrosamine transaminase [Sulfuritalea sp.]